MAEDTCREKEKTMGHFEDSKLENAHKKLLAPRVQKIESTKQIYLNPKISLVGAFLIKQSLLHKPLLDMRWL